MPTLATMQRQVSPIPPGRYWITVLGELQIGEFEEWVSDMAGAVRLTHVEHDTSGKPVAMFVIFEVPPGRAPFLDAQRFGYPNHAPIDTVKQSSDVERAPEPEGFGLPSFGSAIGGLGLLVVAFLLLSSNR